MATLYAARIFFTWSAVVTGAFALGTFAWPALLLAGIFIALAAWSFRPAPNP